MKNLILFLFLSVAMNTFAASGSPLKTGIESDQNRIDMLQVREGMEDCEIIKIMGHPYKKEKHEIDHEFYEIWYYLTKPVQLGQTQYIDENFTPFIFQNSHLLGWGKLYYRHLLDIDNARKSAKEEKRQAYTNDEDEWPPKGTHVIIPPPKKKQPPKEKPSKSQPIPVKPKEAKVPEAPIKKETAPTVPEKQPVTEKKDVDYPWID